MTTSRKLYRALLALTAAIAFAALAPAAPAALAPEGKGRYIVVFEDSVAAPAAVAQAQSEQRGGKLGFVYRDAVKGYSALLPTDELERLRRDPRVKYVTPDHRLRPFAQSTPTGIDRIFATANGAVDIDEADDLRADVDVAVIDSGIDHEHEDLNVVARTDCSVATEGAFKCSDGSGVDEFGHGTHVAGTIGALDNGKGVVGVAAGARLWAVKVSLAFPTELFESSAMAGVDWVASHSDQIEVANMSFGCTEGFDPDCESLPALESAIGKAAKKGVVFVAAAGNESTDAANTHPASQPDVITVSALDDQDGTAAGNDFLAWFSNYGSTVEVAAPGVGILSTVPGGYEENSGTSMAAPHVAGAAALLASHENPENLADVEAIREAIVEEGNFNWSDFSGDGIKEPLLDVSDEALFRIEIDPPANTALPQVGPKTPVEGQAASATKGSWTESPTSYAYQWKRCNAAGGECVSIGGATASTYLVGEADVGKTLRAAVTAKNSGGETTATSNATNQVEGVPDPQWSNSGAGIKVSGSLTVYKNGANAKTCTPTVGQVSEMSSEEAWASIGTFAPGELNFPCGSGMLSLSLVLNAIDTKTVEVGEYFPGVQSPWGGYWTQGAWVGGSGPAIADFKNGSGSTASTLTFSNDILGSIPEGTYPTITATGTLKVTTSSGGLLTLVE